MNSNTKIVVIKMKELIIGAIAVAAAIILLIVILSSNACSNDKSESATHPAKTTSVKPADSTIHSYTPGVYTASVTLNGEPVDVQVTVDKNSISNIELKNLSDSVTTMYPMLQTSFNELAAAVMASGSTENITYNADSKYTTTMILDAIKNALSKAVLTES